METAAISIVAVSKNKKKFIKMDTKRVKYLNVDGVKYQAGAFNTSELVNDSSFVSDASMISYIEERVDTLTNEEIDSLLN